MEAIRTNSWLIAQHEFGIILPHQDRNKVTQLEVLRPSSCFTFSITDSRVGLATLAHVDTDRAYETSNDVLVQQLQAFRAEEVLIQTANLHKPSSGNRRRRPQREASLEDLMKKLNRAQIPVSGGIYKDVGDVKTGQGVIVDPLSGLRVVSSSELRSPTNQRVRAFLVSLNYLLRYSFKHDMAPLRENYLPDLMA